MKTVALAVTAFTTKRTGGGGGGRSRPNPATTKINNEPTPAITEVNLQKPVRPKPKITITEVNGIFPRGNNIFF
jgi:hypothetical protein